MKKSLFTLAVLVMAFGNVAFAQHKTNLKSNATQHMLKHYGLRDGTDLMPEAAVWRMDEEMFRVTYYYDENEYYLNEEVYEMKWDEEEWRVYGAVTYEYDFYGNVIEACEQSWDGGVWQFEARATYTYQDYMVSEVVYQYWENGWVNDIKEVYNFNDNVSTVLIWEWNGNNWSSSELYTYTSDGLGTMELLIQYMQGGAWQNDEKHTYTLDFDENVTEILEQGWAGNTWVNSKKTTYDYENGIYVDMLVEDWTGSAWEETYRYDFTYVDGNATHGECFQMSGGEWVPANGDIEMAYDYNSETKTFFGSEVDMTYVDLTSVDENAQVTNFMAYPVPAENEILIEAESFQKAEIYSVTGQKLMESQQNKMNIGTLSQGVYLLKVFDLDGNSSVQRIVVK